MKEWFESLDSKLDDLMSSWAIVWILIGVVFFAIYIIIKVIF